MFVKAVRDHGGLTPPKACNNKWICRILVVFTIFFMNYYYNRLQGTYMYTPDRSKGFCLKNQYDE